MNHREVNILDEGDVLVSDHRRNASGAVLHPRRFTFVRLSAIVILGLLFFQAFRLQVTSGSLFRREAEGNRVRELVEYAPRGIFLDREGYALVQNVPLVTLVAEPSLIPEDTALLFVVLAEALPKRDLGRVRERLQAVDRTSQVPLLLLQGLSHQEYIAITSRVRNLPGIRTETRTARSYAGGRSLAHVLGYVSLVNPEEQDRFPTYALTDVIGKVGLEREVESFLRGRHGVRRVEVDAGGNVRHDLGRVPPTPGLNIRLHLDAALQKKVIEALERGARAAGVRKGSAIALDPQSGAVRALASLPSYSNTAFALGEDREEIEKTLRDPSSPLLNRATQGEYLPGSTFKLAVAAAALEEGIATQATAVESTGGIRVGPWFFPDWKTGGHGRTNLEKALAESVNTYFYFLAGGLGEDRGLGIERMTDWARRLGAGERTGIDLPDEADGFLPSPHWKESVKRERWYIGDTYHAAIGQGDVLLTPLQLAVISSVIANGGTLYAPRLIDAIEGPGGGALLERRAPVVRAEQVVRASTAEIIRRGMRAAVTRGSARGLDGLPVPVGAKTGTAQIGGTERTHAWVTVLAPWDRPELVLVILLEEAGAGDRYAVPVAREVLEWYLQERRPPRS